MPAFTLSAGNLSIRASAAGSAGKGPHRAPAPAAVPAALADAPPARAKVNETREKERRRAVPYRAALFNAGVPSSVRGRKAPPLTPGKSAAVVVVCDSPHLHSLLSTPSHTARPARGHAHRLTPGMWKAAWWSCSVIKRGKRLPRRILTQRSTLGLASAPSKKPDLTLTLPSLPLSLQITARPSLPRQDLPTRPRRNRRSPTIRSAVRETILTPANLLLPLFIHEGAEDVPIPSMPGVSRLAWRTGLLAAVDAARAQGVNSVVLFPKTPEALKTRTGEEAFNPDGLVQRAIRLLKAAHPDLEVYTDVALDPYNSDGHDGIVRDDGVILNDETVEFLCRQAVSQAEAGADCVSPSDMMDGRVGAIRGALDAAGFPHVGIMSYTAKYASAFYGPFRDALASAPRAGGGGRVIPPTKATYQQDPANWRESLREAAADEAEGADVLMVKPGLPYLDVIRLLRDSTALPIAAYHVSGEYAMLKAAAERGWLDERAAVLESLLCLKRAGADIILTYYATQAATWLNEDGFGVR